METQMEMNKALPSLPRDLRAGLRYSTLAQAAAIAVATMGAAHAQQAPATSAVVKQDVIVVTGIRKGIEDAISVKKGADGIVESVSAEDIGKLPDSSIAESIARLPGVAAQRVNGRATEISIRGLSGDFANTLLNGREQVSTGNNRSVQFDQYPSELLAGVTIYKTPDSALVGQGLSGTIDLQTVRPLNFGGRTISLNIRNEKNGQGTPFTGDGTRFNATYIDQFANRTVGLAVGYAKLKQSVRKTRTETYGESDSTSFPNVNGGQNFTFNQGFKYFVDDTDETRDAAMLALEFRPNKDMTSVLDVFYSKFDKQFVKRGLEIQVNDSWKNGGPNASQAATLSNAVIQNGRLMSGTWGNVNPLSRHIWEPRNDELNSYGWNTKWKFAPKWTGVLDLNYSSAKSKEQIAEMEAGQWSTATNSRLSENVTIANYNQVTGLQYDRNNVSTLRLTDPESWGQNGYNKTISTDDKLSAIRLSAARDLDGFFSKLNLGFNHTKRDKTKGSIEEFLRLPAGTSTGSPLPAGTVGLPIPGTNLATVSFDPAAIYPSAYRLDPNVNGDILRKGWTVNEKISTYFAKADVDTEFMGMNLRGNMGAQIVQTDQSSTAATVDNTNQGRPGSITQGKSYTDVLPSVNLTLDIGNDQLIRTGFGRQMARPRMDQLSAFRRSEVSAQSFTDLPAATRATLATTCATITATGKTCGVWTGSGGNPTLDPFRADAFDISYEKYFGNKGYISVAAFYKNLKSYVYEFTDRGFDFTGFNNLNPNNTAVSNLGSYTRPVNGQGGTINGVEFAVSVPLSLMSKSLDGFGVQFNYSDTQSKIQPFGPADTRPLPGLSPQVQNLTLYYEKSGFSARVNQRTRASFIAEISGFGGDREYKYARKETILDWQMGYEFRSGPAKGLSLLLQVNNAGNEPYVEYDPKTDKDTKTDKYGKTVLFGATYKF
jgi:iron complex outermembrane recepter protein